MAKGSKRRATTRPSSDEHGRKKSRMDNVTFVLLCLLEGDANAFPLKVASNQYVALLKEAIKEKIGSDLEGISAHNLQVWKLDKSKNEAKNLTKADMKGEELDETSKISRHWQEETLADVIHIFVARPPFPSVAIDCASTSLGRPILVSVEILAEELDSNLVHLYNMFWNGDSYNACSVDCKILVPDINTMDLDSAIKTEHTFKILTLQNEPKGVHFPFSSTRDIVIMPNFQTLLDRMLKMDADWCLTHEQAPENKSTAVLGQPGIGKTIFLDYLLIYRLVHKLPTIICKEQGLAHIFTKDGVRHTKPIPGAHTGIEELEDWNCCVLINISDDLKKPPSTFHPNHRIARAVVATPPNPTHLDNFSKEKMATPCILPLWDWATLYGAAIIMHPTRDESFDKQLREAWNTMSLLLQIQRGRMGCSS